MKSISTLQIPRTILTRGSWSLMLSAWFMQNSAFLGSPLLSSCLAQTVNRDCIEYFVILSNIPQRPELNPTQEYTFAQVTTHLLYQERQGVLFFIQEHRLAIGKLGSSQRRFDVLGTFGKRILRVYNYLFGFACMFVILSCNTSKSHSMQSGQSEDTAND